MANKIVIKDSKWRKVYTNDGHYLADVPDYIVDNFVDAVQFLENMASYKDLQNYPGYDSKQKQGEWKGYRGIRLNKQRRLLFRQDTSTDPITIYIDYVDNGHYK